MTIVVTYDNEVLGSGEHWRGDAADIEAIRSRVARWLAEGVAKDGQTRTDGMWTVRVLRDNT